MTKFPVVTPVDPEKLGLFRLLSVFEPMRVRLASALAAFLLRHPTLGSWFGRALSLWDLIVGEIVYGRHVSSQASMWRARQQVLGDTFASFRAVVECSAQQVEGLLERTPPELRRTNAFVAQYAQPDLLSASTFLFSEGPTHDRHRAVLVGRVLGRALSAAEPVAVDALLRTWRQRGDFGQAAIERVLTRCTHRLMLGLTLDEAQAETALSWQRTFFSPVMFAPPWARRTVLGGAQRRLEAARATMEALYAQQPLLQTVAGSADGLPMTELAPMIFEVLNLNAAAIQSISMRVVRLLSEHPALQAELRDEHARLGLDACSGGLADAGLRDAVKTEHFVLEVLRLFTRVTTVQWRSDAPFSVVIGGREQTFPAGTLRCANLATANVDPAVFPEPFVIKLDRDYSRFMNFNGVTSPRTCPGRGFSLGLLVRFTVHALGAA
jgi:cytochrome P450